MKKIYILTRHFDLEEDGWIIEDVGVLAMIGGKAFQSEELCKKHLIENREEFNGYISIELEELENDK